MPSGAGVERTRIDRRPEPFDFQPQIGQLGRRRLDPVAVGLVELDHFGNQQRLARDFPAVARGPHAFEDQPLVRGMLVDDHQPVLGFGDDVGRGDLPARNAERIVRNRRGGRLGACLAA